MNTKIHLSLGSDSQVCRSIDGWNLNQKIQSFSIMSLLSCSFLMHNIKTQFYPECCGTETSEALFDL